MSYIKSWVVAARDSIRTAAHRLFSTPQPWVTVVTVLGTATLLILGGLTVIAGQGYHALLAHPNISSQAHLADATAFPATEAFFVVVAFAVMLLGVFLLRDLKPYNARPWSSLWVGLLAIFLILMSFFAFGYLTWRSLS